MYQIYKHTVPNGKVYIGYTSQKTYTRFNGGNNYKFNAEFYSDIVEYGWKNVTHEVLEEVATKEQALERECYYIQLYHSYDPEYGYNKHTNVKYNKHDTIICVETGETYPTMTEAAAACGLTRQAVSLAVKEGRTCRNGRTFRKI